MWFIGLDLSVSQTKMKSGSSIKLDRELAQLLEEELRQRRTSIVPLGEVYGKRDGVDLKIR